jgi:hypothetical protein
MRDGYPNSWRLFTLDPHLQMMIGPFKSAANFRVQDHFHNCWLEMF